MKRFLITLLLTASLATMLTAQDYRYEVGPALGISGNLSDVNNSNLFKHPGVAGGGIFRYNINTRWALKANLAYAGISGNNKGHENEYPGGQEYKFKAHLIDASATMEFNFMHFGQGPKYKNLKRIVPYMTAGLGMVASFTDGHMHASPVIPLGAGVKFRVKDRLNLGFEFTMRKEFSDKIDGLSNLYGIKHGLAKNTEWYSMAVFTVTYEFSKRCTKCHYVE